MPTIPVDQKFHTVPAEVDTQDRGSARANADREIYTMQDIIDTVGGGGGSFIGLSDTPSSYPLGSAGQAVVVNSGEDGLEFAAVGGGTSVDGQVISYTVRDTPFSNFNDGEYEGETIDLGNNFDGGFGTPGLLYYWTGSVWAAADNTAESTSIAMLGVLTNKLTGGNYQTVLLNGIIRLNVNPSGVTTNNEPLYVGTGSAITATIPTASGSVSRLVGHAFNSTDPYMIRFNPSNDWIEIA